MAFRENGGTPGIIPWYGLFERRLERTRWYVIVNRILGDLIERWQLQRRRGSNRCVIGGSVVRGIRGKERRERREYARTHDMIWSADLIGRVGGRPTSLKR